MLKGDSNERFKQRTGVGRNIRIAEECQGACVREICITNEVPDYVGGKEPSLWIIGGQEFDDAEPVLPILPVGLEIVFAMIARSLSFE